jgi:hypothetical protein
MKGLAASVLVVALMLGIAAGCGGAARGPKSAARPNCARLTAATNTIGPAITEITGIPASDRDALHRVAYAMKELGHAVRQVDETTAPARVGRPRIKLLSALTSLLHQLAVARRDLRIGRTQQARSQGYVDAGIGIAKVNDAEAGVLAACLSSH